jgi:hypothetical protein
VKSERLEVKRHEIERGVTATPHALRFHFSPFTSYDQLSVREMEMFCAMEIRTRWTTSRNPYTTQKNLKVAR